MDDKKKIKFYEVMYEQIFSSFGIYRKQANHSEMHVELNSVSFCAELKNIFFQ